MSTAEPIQQRAPMQSTEMQDQRRPMRSNELRHQRRPVRSNEMQHQRAPARSSDNAYSSGPLRSTEIEERDFSDAASDVEVEELSSQYSMGSAQVYAPDDIMLSERSDQAYAPDDIMLSERSDQAYAPNEGMLSERSDQAYAPQDNAMMRTRSTLRTPPTNIIPAHFQLRLGPGDRWPSGESYLPNFSNMLSLDRSVFSGLNAFSAAPGSTSTFVSLIRLSASEQYEDLEHGYARRLLLTGDCLPGSSMTNSTFLVRYVCRGERANGDPVAMIDVRPTMYQFAILEHLAKVASDLTSARISKSARSYPECMGIVVAFQELGRFFQAYRFDWDDENGLRVSY